MLYKTARYKAAVILFILPAMTLYLVVMCYPILQTIHKSFFSWDGISPAIFSGFENYKFFVSDPDMPFSIKNGILFALVVVVYQIGTGSILAFLTADNKVKFYKLFKSSYFIPVILASSLVAQLWLFIYNADNGLINSIFEMLHIDYRQNVLGNRQFGIIAIAFVNAWQYMGYSFVLLYSGIKLIPQYLDEAARIDGASKLQTVVYIKIPLLAEIYKFCLILAVTGGLKAFTEMFIMTGGGPGNTNFTLSLMMYKAAFRINEYGYGCAISVVLFIECLVAMYIVNKFVAIEKIEY
jgi:raffinose/stachyose/melibiose transport system permease protein